MNEDKEVLLFEVVFDAKEAEKNAQQLRVNIERLKAARSELSAEFKKGDVTAEEFGKSMQAISKQLAGAEAELKDTNKALAEHEKAEKSAAFAVATLQAKLVVMTTTYGNLTKAQQQNSQAGTQLKAQIVGVATELETLTKQAQSSGQGLDTLLDSIDGLDDQIAGLQKQYNALSEAQRNNKAIGGALLSQINELTQRQEKNKKALDDSRKSWKDYIREFSLFGTSIGSALDAFKGGGQGVATFTKSIFTARGALVALTAVPIIAVLTGLYALLTKSQAGMDFMARAAGSVSAIFNVLIERGIKLGSAFVHLFTNVKLAYQEFKEAFTGLPEALNQAASAGAAVVKENQRIRESERAIRVERAKNRAQIEELKKIAEDTTKSQQERERAAREAYGLEYKTLRQQIALQESKIAVARKEAELSQNTAADLDKIADAEIELAELRKESAGRQTELQNQLNQIRLEGEQRTAQDALDIAQNALDNIEKANKETYERIVEERTQTLDRQLASDLAAVAKGSDQEKKLRLQYDADIQQAQIDATTATYTATYEAKKKVLEKQLALDLVGVDKGSKQALALQTKFNLELNQLKLKSSLEIADAELRIERDTIEAKIALAQEGSKEMFDLRRQLALNLYKQEFNATVDTIKNEKEKNEQILKLDNELAAERKKIKAEERAVELKAQDDQLAAQLAKTRAGSKAETDVRIQQVRKRIGNALGDEKVGIDEFKKIQAEGFREIDDLTDDFRNRQIEQIVGATNQLASSLSGLFDAISQRQLKTLDDQQGAALKSAGLSAAAREKIEQNFAKKREKIERESAEKRRKIALVEAIINTAGAVIKAAPNVLLIALAGFTGLAQVGVIEAQQFEKGGIIGASQQFEYGGEIVDGPSHKHGGKKYRVGPWGRIVELEGGEGVVNKRSMAIPGVREKVSALNELGGGVRFPGVKGTPNYVMPPRMELGGAIAVQQQAIAQQMDIDYNRLGKVVSGMVLLAVESMPAPYVVAQDVADVNDRRKRVEARANH